VQSKWLLLLLEVLCRIKLLLQASSLVLVAVTVLVVCSLRKEEVMLRIQPVQYLPVGKNVSPVLYLTLLKEISKETMRLLSLLLKPELLPLSEQPLVTTRSVPRLVLVNSSPSTTLKLLQQVLSHLLSKPSLIPPLVKCVLCPELDLASVLLLYDKICLAFLVLFSLQPRKKETMQISVMVLRMLLLLLRMLPVLRGLLALWCPRAMSLVLLSNNSNSNNSQLLQW
jgi:hypothetical protein